MNSNKWNIIVLDFEFFVSLFGFVNYICFGSEQFNCTVYPSVFSSSTFFPLRKNIRQKLNFCFTFFSKIQLLDRFILIQFFCAAVFVFNLQNYDLLKSIARLLLNAFNRFDANVCIKELNFCSAANWSAKLTLSKAFLSPHAHYLIFTLNLFIDFFP